MGVLITEVPQLDAFGLPFPEGRGGNGQGSASGQGSLRVPKARGSRCPPLGLGWAGEARATPALAGQETLVLCWSQDRPQGHHTFLVHWARVGGGVVF